MRTRPSVIGAIARKAFDRSSSRHSGRNQAVTHLSANTITMSFTFPGPLAPTHDPAFHNNVAVRSDPFGSAINAARILRRSGVPRRPHIRRVRLVIITDQLNLAAKETALGIDFLFPDLGAEQRLFAVGRRRPGLGQVDPVRRSRTPTMSAASLPFKSSRYFLCQPAVAGTLARSGAPVSAP
jgi:hypothetical protein